MIPDFSHNVRIRLAGLNFSNAISLRRTSKDQKFLPFIGQNHIKNSILVYFDLPTNWIFVHMDIGLTTYLPFVNNLGHLTDHLPTSSCPRSLWTTPYTAGWYVWGHWVLAVDHLNHQNFKKSLLSYECGLVFIGMKQKKKFFWKKIQNGQLKKLRLSKQPILIIFCNNFKNC